jgi:hypothetical protein
VNQRDIFEGIFEEDPKTSFLFPDGDSEDGYRLFLYVLAVIFVSFVVQSLMRY